MTTLTNSLGLSSLYAVVATHFDLVCWCFFSVFFWKLQFSFFQACSRHYKRNFRSTFQIDREPVRSIGFFLFFVSGCGEGGTLHLFLQCSFVLLILFNGCEGGVWRGAGPEQTGPGPKSTSFNLGLGAGNDYF